MATLVLGTVGTILGGPLGGAIGSLIGSQFDQAILGSGPDRIGPRLAEISVQTSSYGTAIPQIFGTMRSAGSVIWASDLIENSNREGGGKGRPSSVTFSYSANFAVALSSRPIASIGRIWADGNLLRGVRGDFKSETLFRFYTGHEDQNIDPLIASAEGLQDTPAHRGIAYAVFENMQLADFGNRIPSLTFEIINHDGALEIVNIASALSEGLIKAAPNNADDSQPNNDENSIKIIGYSASQSNSREAIDNLMAPLTAALRAKENALIWTQGRSDIIQSTSPIAYSQSRFEGRSDNQFDRPQILTVPIHDIPKQSSLRYYDPSREYQAGLQSSSRPGPGRAISTIDYTAAIHANDARNIVQQLQVRDIFARHSLVITLVRDQIYHSGDYIQFDDIPYIWKIIQVEQDLDVFTLTLHAISVDNMAMVNRGDASAGRAISAADEIAGETLMAVLDLPALSASRANIPNIAIAAAGTQAGWRRANLFQRDGGNIIPIASVNSITPMGVCVNVLGAASPFLTDRHNQPMISLAHDNMRLPMADNKNALGHFAMIGEEIIQFEYAEYRQKDDAGFYILHGLKRGVGATQDYIDKHQEAERFILLDSETLHYLQSDSYQLGQDLTIEAMGIGDTHPQSDNVSNIGAALRPLSPVHLQIDNKHDGDILIQWIRRSRIPSRWSDGVDIAMDENTEQYALTIRDGDADGNLSIRPLADEILGINQYVITQNQRAQWQASGINAIIISIVQIGTYARSNSIISRHIL